MIRIYKKNLFEVPASLVDKTDTTEKHWEAVVRAGAWCDSERYKEEDVKEALRSIYDNKCAYCEKKLLDMPKHVEHFRPKQANPKIKTETCDASYGYYWLGFSWDNLIWACGECNSPKNSCFDIRGTRATYAGEPFANIHRLSAAYDAIERPLFFNPETADPAPLIDFDASGQIYSPQNDPQIKYTIERCKLYRVDLLQCRMIILNKLKKALSIKANSFGTHRDRHRLKQDIEHIVHEFWEEAAEDSSEFAAWRRCILKKAGSFLSLPTQVATLTILLVIEESRRNPNLQRIF